MKWFKTVQSVSNTLNVLKFFPMSICHGLHSSTNAGIILLIDGSGPSRGQAPSHYEAAYTSNLPSTAINCLIGCINQTIVIGYLWHGSNLIVGQLWHSFDCWSVVARILLASHPASSQPAS